MKNSFLLFLFFFCNFLNPISLIFTISVNLVLILFTFKPHLLYYSTLEILILTLLIFVWSIIIMSVQDTYNNYVFFKYFRVFISSILIYQLSINFSGNLDNVLNTLSIIFKLHIVAIGLQVLFPILNLPMAFFFQFDREAEVITSMGIRNLGLTSSYDTASLISVIAMIFFLVRYQFTNKTFFYILSALSLVSTMRTSRTGMVLGVILFICLNAYLFFSKKEKSLFLTFLFFAFGLSFLLFVLLPIIASTTETFLSDTSFNNLDNTNRDYTESTVSGLTSGSHLTAILEISPIDFLFGKGIDPNELLNLATDIGYIKLIYHVGFIGLIGILFLYLKIFIMSINLKNISESANTKILASFILWYIIILILFNYKSLELYSRGSHDLLLAIFFILFFTVKKKPEIKN